MPPRSWIGTPARSACPASSCPNGRNRRSPAPTRGCCSIVAATGSTNSPRSRLGRTATATAAPHDWRRNPIHLAEEQFLFALPRRVESMSTAAGLEVAGAAPPAGNAAHKNSHLDLAYSAGASAKRAQLRRLLAQIDVDEATRRRSIQQAILQAESWWWRMRA